MIQHEITSVDACVTIDEGICVMVVGRLKVRECTVHPWAADVWWVNSPDVSGMGLSCLSTHSSLQADNDPPHGFVQSFYLKQVQGNVFVLNDIFRLVLHHSA